MKPHNHTRLHIDVNQKKCQSRVKWNADLILVLILCNRKIYRKRFQSEFVQKKNSDNLKTNKQQQQQPKNKTKQNKTKQNNYFNNLRQEIHPLTNDYFIKLTKVDRI